MTTAASPAPLSTALPCKPSSATDVVVIYKVDRLTRGQRRVADPANGGPSLKLFADRRPFCNHPLLRRSVRHRGGPFI